MESHPENSQEHNDDKQEMGRAGPLKLARLLINSLDDSTVKDGECYCLCISAMKSCMGNWEEQDQLDPIWENLELGIRVSMLKRFGQVFWRLGIMALDHACW